MLVYYDLSNYDCAMNNKILYILMVMIVLQSSVAMSDFYQPHHSEDEHTQTIISNQTLSNIELESHQHSLEEVNHSCHHFCASNTITFINLNELLNLNSLNFNSNLLNTNSNHFKSRTVAPGLRPPIA